jgi:hypothetical protein
MNTAMTSSATDNAGKTTRARQNGQDNAGMTMPTIRRQAMTDLFDNPMGLDGFEFVEFAALGARCARTRFEMMGFALVARHKTKDVDLWRQGGINFIANYEKHPRRGTTPRSTVPAPAAWRFASATRPRPTRWRWITARSRSTFPAARWS